MSVVNRIFQNLLWGTTTALDYFFHCNWTDSDESATNMRLGKICAQEPMWPQCSCLACRQKCTLNFWISKLVSTKEQFYVWPEWRCEIGDKSYKLGKRDCFPTRFSPFVNSVMTYTPIKKSKSLSIKLQLVNVTQTT